VTDSDGPARFEYTPEDNDTFPWTEITPGDLFHGEPPPVRLFVARYKSSSIDSERFIHDPVTVLRETGLDAFAGIDNTWRITTQVINHENTLSASHTVSSASVQGKDVGLTLNKVPAA
jgi:hypothetical protein